LTRFVLLQNEVVFYDIIDRLLRAAQWCLGVVCEPRLRTTASEKVLYCSLKNSFKMK